MIDTHSHLYFEQYSNIDQVIIDSKLNNINKIFVVGIDYETSILSINLANRYRDYLFPTIGIHPSEVSKFNNIDQFEKLLLNNTNIIAIGEVGLDYHYSDYDKNKQLYVFEEFIKLAIKYNKPLIIHCRDAYEDAIGVLEKYKGRVRGVFHCYSSTLLDAKKIIELGFLLGIGGVITFSSAKELVNIVSNIDLDKIILETDCPFLAPSPFRGKTNYPYYVKYVYEHVSKIKNIEINELIKLINDNVNKLFN